MRHIEIMGEVFIIRRYDPTCVLETAKLKRNDGRKKPKRIDLHRAGPKKR